MSEMSSDDKYINKQVRTISPPNKRKLGEIFVENGVLTAFTVERILTLSKRSGIRFGSILEEIGLVTGEELAQALATQYGYKTVNNLAAYNFKQEVIGLVPAETAVEHTIFPLKTQNNTLAIAMADPTNDKLINNLEQNCQMRIYPFIATRKDINNAIAKHYFNKESAEMRDETILVVEDDKLSSSIITSILNKAGYKTMGVFDGMEAFREIMIIKPRLILTDKEMPKFGGYALLESLKKIPETKTIPVILISGSTNPEEESSAYEKGFVDYIPKPINEVSLKAKVKKALNNHNHLSVLSCRHNLVKL